MPLTSGRGGIAFPQHSLGVMEVETLVRKNEETKIACENRGLFLHSSAHGVPINFNRSFALQLLMEERAPLYSFMGLWPYSVTLQRKAKSTVDIGRMEKERMMWL